MRSPFDVTVYNRSFGFVGKVNDFTSLTVTPRHNQVGTADLTVASDHRQLPGLAARGSRLLIRYEGEHLMSGYLPTSEGRGPEKQGEFTFHCVDDLWLLWRMLGWPVPGADLLSQGTKKNIRTGPAESVLKGFVTANLPHLVDSVTVAPDLGRGTTITVESRMALLSDVLMTEMDAAGIGVSVRQSGTGLLVDCYEPRVYPHALSEESGAVLAWQWSQAEQTLTSAIVGGPNENTSREFRRVRDAATESALGYTVEGFVDARQADSTSQIDAAGTQAIVEAGPANGFSVSLSTTPNLAYGTHGVRVGDQVTVDVGGQTMTDVLREAPMTFPSDEGLTITPTIGERSDDPDRNLAGFLKGIARGIRDLRTR